MSDVRSDVWENSKTGAGPCEGCPNAGGEYNHPGFFNPEADVLVVDEAPSESHFDLPNYDRSNDYEWYRRYYEDTNRESILGWPPVDLFLGPVFEAFGYSREDLFDLVFLTSAVTCPTGDLDAAYRHCRSYLERELEHTDPAVVVAAGARATEWTARLLGVPDGDVRDVSISRPEWWGLSDFATDPPLIHVPHWGYYNTHHRLSDDEWEAVVEATRAGLEAVQFE